MKFLPIGLKIDGKKILLVGGGKVALQKIRRLKPFTQNLTVLACEISQVVQKTGVRCLKRSYRPSCLKGFSLVYACTNDGALNREIHRDAERLGIPVNVVDCPEESDFISPAIYKKGSMTVAVSSDGRNARRSVLLRDRIKESLDKKKKSSR
jgi:precorrin-2 dehydrogenase/sirohydrochlorin ferrochelatase